MKTKALLLTVLLAGAFAIPVLGTTVPKMDLKTLISNSDHIVSNSRGRATDTRGSPFV